MTSRNRINGPFLSQKGDEKLQTSVNTASTSNYFFKNKPSLMSCCSSVSIEQDEYKNKHRQQRRLFMKLLALKQQWTAQTKIVSQMGEHFQKIGKVEEVQVFGHATPKIEYMPGYFSKQFYSVFQHYCGIWLIGMGFKTQKNKQMVIDRARLFISTQQIYLAVLFYQTLGAGLIAGQERWELITSTCLNGWQYFSSRAIEFCLKSKKKESKGYN